MRSLRTASVAGEQNRTRGRVSALERRFRESPLDLPWAYGEADLHTDGTSAVYFGAVSSDESAISYYADGRQWLLHKPGVYLAFHYAELETSDALPAMGTRLNFLANYESHAGGDLAGPLLIESPKAGSVGFSPSEKQWRLNLIDVVTATSARLAVSVSLAAGASDGGNYLLGVNSAFFQLNQTVLDDPF
jgi:hypothetical protein